jgi:hypothetical protein
MAATPNHKISKVPIAISTENRIMPNIAQAQAESIIITSFVDDIKEY